MIYTGTHIFNLEPSNASIRYFMVAEIGLLLNHAVAAEPISMEFVWDDFRMDEIMSKVEIIPTRYL